MTILFIWVIALWHFFQILQLKILTFVKHFLLSPCEKIHHKKNIAQNKFLVYLCVNLELQIEVNQKLPKINFKIWNWNLFSKELDLELDSQFHYVWNQSLNYF
jgi:hypothetical protein